MKIIHHDIGRDRLYKIWHCLENENMIIYTYSNGGSIVFQDKIYPIKKGTLCFIGTDKHHYTMPDNPSVYDRSKILIPENIVQGYINLFEKKEGFCNLFLENSVVYAMIPSKSEKEVSNIYKEAEIAFKENPADIQTLTCCFFRLMSYIQKYTTEQIGLADDFMTKVIDIINRKYSNELTLDYICNEMHMSKYHFCRKFKSTMGITVMEYILKTRLTAAKNKLTKGKLPISEISEKCGFSSISYFCQVFKRSTGITPSEYRKKFTQK